MVEFAPGTVWLIGAGPGDPDLLTRKAERLIGAADVVFVDALVGEGVRALIPSRAEQVFVGKRSGRHSKSQESINALLQAAALDGKRVARLKGGDPSVFGRSAEEMAALRAVGVPVFVCPGVTAASAAAASLGVSLTARGTANRLQFVTAHARADASLDLDWTALADPQATLAIYMGKAAAPAVRAALMAHGLSGATPVAVVENASLPDERRLSTRLDLLPLAVRALGDGPAVILVGAAVAPLPCAHTEVGAGLIGCGISRRPMAPVWPRAKDSASF
ncbi:MAG: uroporphyrinogen-III C-methyltransferase [Sphingomonadales bacterium]|nr:MAG: uroporphyrinogen-III C-methyltransferase [Sphingomonadales bacterium]